jgi:hypothetical protein
MIADNVMTAKEIDTMKSFVYSNKDKWSKDIDHIGKVKQENKDIWNSFGMSDYYYKMCIPAGKYILRQNPWFRAEVLKHVNFRKICDILKKEFEVEDVFLSGDYNFPAFHVLVNPYDRKAHYDQLYMHIDGINPWLHKPLQSIVYTLQLPTEPCGLDWIDETGTQQRQNYKENAIYVFSGDKVKHGISELFLEPNEARITLQMFTIYLTDTKLLLTSF